MPIVLLGISVAMSILYDKAFKMKNNGIPFHESYAYPVMLIAFVLALGMLAWLFLHRFILYYPKLHYLIKQFEN